MPLQQLKPLLLIIALLFWIFILFPRAVFNPAKQHLVEFPKLEESNLRISIPHRFENFSFEPVTSGSYTELKPDAKTSELPAVYHTSGTETPPALLLLAQCSRTPNRFTNVNPPLALCPFENSFNKMLIVVGLASSDSESLLQHLDGREVWCFWRNSKILEPHYHCTPFLGHQPILDSQHGVSEG
jgi:hypothetical protein